MKVFLRAIRIYAPFICTIMALVNGVFFLNGNAKGDFVYLAAASTGHSIVVVLYFFAASRKMCIWYKLNLTCLLLVQICGLLYKYKDMPFTVYLYIVILISALGIFCFLVFRVFYKVTNSFLCNRRGS